MGSTFVFKRIKSYKKPKTIGFLGFNEKKKKKKKKNLEVLVK